MSDLYLDTDLLKGDNETSSLEDVYGYKIFNNKFEENMKTVAEKNKNDLNNSVSNVFNYKKKENINVYYKNVMNAGTSVIKKNDYSNNNTSNQSIYNVGIVASGMIVAGLIFYYIDRRLKKRNAKKNNN